MPRRTGKETELAEIVRLKDARRKQGRTAGAGRMGRLPSAAVPGWAYFLGLVLLAGIVAALRSL